MAEKPKENPGFTLKDLIDIREWKKIQDNFSFVTGVSLRTIDTEGGVITKPSREPKLCSELLKGSALKDEICGSCLPTFLGGNAVVDRNLSYLCKAGLCNFIAPLRFDRSDVLGYIVIGPVILVTRGPKEQYIKAAEELSLNLNDFWNALLDIKVMSFQGIKSLIELVKDLSEYTLKLAYMAKMKIEEAAMQLDLTKLRKLLDSILNVAFEISKADVGSLMVLDEARGNLTIKSSRGIPEEIANSASIRLGEGISGIVAKEGNPYLIDENFKDNRIKNYLNRPYIGSSMVIPLKIEKRVLGVMNLGALKTSPIKFNSDNVEIMLKLTELVTVAITPVN